MWPRTAIRIGVHRYWLAQPLGELGVRGQVLVEGGEIAEGAGGGDPPGVAMKQFRSPAASAVRRSACGAQSSFRAPSPDA